MQNRIRVRFSGHVQGVGFRWTTKRIACAYDISGWVRNNPDGSVDLEAEGEKKEVDAFLEEIRASLGHFIRKESSQRMPAGVNSGGFDILH